MARFSKDQQQVKIDVKDKKILVLLSEDSRMPISELAKKVRLKRDTVAYRIKRLQELGVIKRFFPVISLKRIGYNLYQVFLVIDESKSDRVKELYRKLNSHDHTVSVIEYSDRWDLHWKFVAQNVNQFDNILSEMLEEFRDIILERDVLLAFSTHHSILLPYKFPNIKPKQRMRVEGTYFPDDKDFRILHALTNDARQSTYKISEQVGLSADAVRLRIRRLYDEMIIKKFTIVIDFATLGFEWYTFAIRMRSFTKTQQDKMKVFIADHPHIIKAVKMIGSRDFIMYITAGNQREFHKTIKEIKILFADVIKKYDTFVAYDEHTFNPLPNCITAGALHRG